MQCLQHTVDNCGEVQNPVRRQCRLVADTSLANSWCSMQCCNVIQLRLSHAASQPDIIFESRGHFMSSRLFE
jgi:hypothetical protein